MEEATNLTTLRLIYDDAAQKDSWLWKESSLVRAGRFLGFEERPVEGLEDPETSAQAENYNKQYQGQVLRKIVFQFPAGASKIYEKCQIHYSQGLERGV